MPIAAFTVGSFGDVMTLLQLLWSLRTAVSGSSAEIRALMIDIDGFTLALQGVQSTIQQRQAAISPELQSGISQAITTCSITVLRMKQHIDAFNRRTMRTIGRFAWGKYWAVSTWNILGGERKVAALKLRLTEQLGVIHTLLAVSQR